MQLIKKEYIFRDVNELRGVGKQLSKYLKKKGIEKIKDILLNLPYTEMDRSHICKVYELEVGKTQTIKVLVKNFRVLLSFWKISRFRKIA